MDPKQAFQKTAAANDNDGAPGDREDDELRKAAAELRRAAEKFAALSAARPAGSATDISGIMNDLSAGLDAAGRAEQTLLPDQMEHNLRVVRGWIANLSDTGMPTLGRDFETLYAGAGFRIGIDPELQCTASYTSFSLKASNPGFSNKITFGKYAAQNPFKLFNAHLHESIHGLQKRACPALQASPFNAENFTINVDDGYGGAYSEDVSIVICPEDWLILQEKCEQDAYAKQAWLNSLLAQTHPDALDAGAKDALSARTFLDCRARAGGDPVQALRLAAPLASQTKFYVDAQGNPTGKYTFANNWQDIALRDYATAIDIRRERGPTNFVFVRISPEDVHALGGAFGPNSFGDNPSDPAMLTRTRSQTTAYNKSFPEGAAARLTRLNEDLGIHNYAALPTLRDYLASHGLTLTDFTARSTRTPSSPAQPRPPAPL